VGGIDVSRAAPALNLDVLQLAALLLTALGLLLAIAAMLRTSRQTHEARQASLSWAIYQEYAEPRIRTARGAVQHLA
jgi:hypothetical protein